MSDPKLKAFIDRVLRSREREDAEKANTKEIYKELAGEGYDKTIVGKVVNHLRKDQDKVREQSDLFDTYLIAYLGASHVHARVREAEAAGADVETGEIIEDNSHPRHGAGGAEDEARVADYGASSSAQPIPAQDSRGTQQGKSKAALPASVDANANDDDSGVDRSNDVVTAGETAPIPEPADRLAADADSDGSIAATAPVATEPAAVLAAEPGDRGSASSLAAATVVETASVDADAGADRSGSRAPSSALAPVVPFRTHNPATHFVNSNGLVRLHGCLKPELCGSSQPRVKLCFDCSLKHDGPTAQGQVA